MRLSVTQQGLRIVPTSDASDERDEVYIENFLGLRKNGDSIKLRRVNCSGVNRIAYLEAAPARGGGEERAQGEER
jgi:hypothetical protein